MAEKKHNNERAASSSAAADTSLAGDSPILAVFLKASKDLLRRHDRHEKLHRLSRDVTIESKRVIFLLHSLVTKEKTKQSIIAEAKKRIQKLIKGPIKHIALVMENVSVYLHHKAITAGLQEFVEARTFLSVIEHRKIVSLTDVRNELTYIVQSKNGHERTISAFLTPQDYMLGLADLTGEMMKRAISETSTGGARELLSDCEMLRDLYTGFLGLYGGSPMLNHKLKVTRANVKKVERALFAFNVRRSEVVRKVVMTQPAPKPSTPSNDHSVEEDQGCY